MKALGLAEAGERLSILCLGAHSDDIEIGAGATLLGLIERGVRLDVHWAVLSATGDRFDEAHVSATTFLAGACRATVDLASFKDGYFPYQGAEIKNWFEALKSKMRATPDIILTHSHHDAHQDHREVSQLTWNTFRDHVILEYEIPKWDGDLGRPNVYIPAARTAMSRKIEILLECFGSQRSKDWFTAETFMALAHLRGNECRASDGLAEAFHIRKLTLR